MKAAKEEVNLSNVIWGVVAASGGVLIKKGIKGAVLVGQSGRKIYKASKIGKKISKILQEEKTLQKIKNISKTTEKAFKETKRIASQNIKQVTKIIRNTALKAKTISISRKVAGITIRPIMNEYGFIRIEKITFNNREFIKKIELAFAKIKEKNISILKNKLANIQDKFNKNLLLARLKIAYLKCLRNSKCKVDEFKRVSSASSLYRKIISKYPHLSFGKVKTIVGKINENIMTKYFTSSGWRKIEGEVGRNGIDGLFIKKTKDGIIKDVLIVESKYDKSNLQYTKYGQQMSKEWILRKIEELEKKFPENPDYRQIKRHIENDNYRALLWHLKEENGRKLLISLKKIHDKGGVVKTTKLVGGEKMKINYRGNQEIDLLNPQNEFHKKIVDWYKSELNNLNID